MGSTKACSKAQPVSPLLIHTSQVELGPLAKHKVEAAELEKRLTHSFNSIQFQRKASFHIQCEFFHEKEKDQTREHSSIFHSSQKLHASTTNTFLFLSKQTLKEKVISV
jgi:hypothetical protein